MFKKNRTYISVLLVFSFMLLVLPKSFLHDCAHQHHSSQKVSKEHGFSFEKGIEKCAVCDLQLPQLFTPESETFFVFFGQDFQEYSTTYISALKASSATFYLRGPPHTV